MTWKGYENAQAARMQIVKLCGCCINPLLRTRISLPVRPPVQMRWSRSARTGCLCVRGLVHPPSVFWDALTGAMNTVRMNEPLAIAPFSALAVARLSACLSRFSSSPLPLPLLTLNMMWKDDFKSLPSSDRSEVCWWDIKTNTGEKKKVRREKRNKCILRVRAQGWDMSHSTLRNPLGSVESNTARLRTHTPSLLCSNFHPHGGSRTQTLESCTRPVGCTACHCGAPSDSSLTAWPNVI